jgi:hypothetical protein
MKVLVDTSVWSLALRRAAPIHAGPARELRNLILDHRVCLIGPICQELLSGIRDESQFQRVKQHLAAFPSIPIVAEDYTNAARFFNVCQSRGIQGSNTDFLICSVAARNRLAIFSTDGDFMHFAKHLPIAMHHVHKTGP